MVECDLAKVEVAGSNPVSRSRIRFTCSSRVDFFFGRARYPSGKGEVCKTFMRRFDSDPRLQHKAHKDETAAPISLAHIQPSHATRRERSVPVWSFLRQ